RVDSQGRLKELGLIRHCSHCLAGLVAAFCRNQPCNSLFTPRASSVRFAGLAPALDPAAHPLELRKKLKFLHGNTSCESRQRQLSSTLSA
ncbi:hypothetical protein, partial [Paraburkholderia elongata]|uniref:hypothetical protein n=1 Tax=Paraburkholderia elongata TaxID=2675747 RepID=UPI001C12CFC4